VPNLDFGFEKGTWERESNLIVDVRSFPLSWSRSNDRVGEIIHHDQRRRASRPAHIGKATSFLWWSEVILAKSTESTEKKRHHVWSTQFRDHWSGERSDRDIRESQDQQPEDISGKNRG
jgi:hypothetical protein